MLIDVDFTLFSSMVKYVSICVRQLHLYMAQLFPSPKWKTNNNNDDKSVSFNQYHQILWELSFTLLLTY